jgi:hypothetical protein
MADSRTALFSAHDSPLAQVKTEDLMLLFLGELQFSGLEVAQPSMMKTDSGFVYKLSPVDAGQEPIGEIWR